MTELSVQEGGNRWLRYGFTLAFVAILILTIVLNALAGSGTDPFENVTGDISRLHQTCITPAGFTFSIWGVIYICLCLNAIYSVSIIFRKVGYEPAWQLGGAVSNLYLGVTCLNLCLNVSWLFAWDADQMVASSVLLILIMATNAAAISFSLYSFMKAAPRLWETSKSDFWCGVLFVNSHGIYDMWTTIAAILNVVIMIGDVSDLNMDSVCIGALSFLLIGIIIYFILEQTLIVEFANPILTHYIVYIWAMIGVYAENKESSSASAIWLVIANLATACIMLVLKVGFMAFRNRNNRIYKKED